MSASTSIPDLFFREKNRFDLRFAQRVPLPPTLQCDTFGSAKEGVRQFDCCADAAILAYRAGLVNFDLRIIKQVNGLIAKRSRR